MYYESVIWVWYCLFYRALPYVVRYCTLLDCDSFIHVDFISLFVSHACHPRFPLNGIKKYLT